MDFLHVTGVVCLQRLQTLFQNQSELMLFLSHVGDPRNAFLIYFPLSFCLHRPTGRLLLWLACISEWLNGVLKWVLHGERPYWWIQGTDLYKGQTTPVLHQYRLTCETGPGSPSGHAMVTASVLLVMTLALNREFLKRWFQKLICWCVYIVVMVTVCVSRCYIATHFPHQVVFGTAAGILLTVILERLPLSTLSLKHYTAVSVLLPVSCLLTTVAMETVGLDPQWSVVKATRWCQSSEWIHLDTRVFNGILRDAGAIMGYGVYCYVCRKLKVSEVAVTNGYRARLLHAVLALTLAQVLENLKPSQGSPSLYYILTFIKFCLLVVMVTGLTMFPWRTSKESENEKNS